MIKTYEWLNRAKARYYTITVQKNNSNIVLNYRWGGCHSSRGGKKDIFVGTEEEAQRHINKMLKRRKSRGYELIAPVAL